MAIAERINRYVSQLPEQLQVEVLDFVEYLLNKVRQESLSDERKEWSSFSLANALQGMEEEDSLFTEADIIDSGG